MKLRHALALRPGDVISFIGAGGKTSALARLARELAAEGARVLVTTTTRMAADERGLFQHKSRIDPSPDAPPSPFAERGREGEILFLYDRIENDKVIGIALEQLPDVIAAHRPDYTLIEADGSRRKPLKYPKAHEPVISPETTLIVNVVGYGALGQPLDEAHIYNADALAQVCMVKPGIEVSADTIAAAAGVMTQPGVRQVALLNAVPPAGSARTIAQRIARLTLERTPTLERVLIGAVQTDDPIYTIERRCAALVLAAGLSSRMGRSKPLLPWGERTVLEQVIGQLRAGLVTDIHVVTGAEHEAVAVVAAGAGVAVVHNPNYAAGEMLSSLHAGLRALPDHVSAALVTLGDQPMIRASNVRKLLRTYAENKGGIVAPSCNMKRGHPILIDRQYWDELLVLSPGSAPRDVINRHTDDIAYVETDDSVLQDIDTPEAYAAALQRFGL
ncbi:MAG: selenium cofactor biosynthesis protein YqeC [Chloroflexota bacterium]|nr:selenium cofactor biosynthesis protein YqeC [Chloroflexota bacterium]